jgi:hypothetical protein
MAKGDRNICNAAKHRILLTATNPGVHISLTCIPSGKGCPKVSMSLSVTRASEKRSGPRAGADEYALATA